MGKIVHFRKRFLLQYGYNSTKTRVTENEVINTIHRVHPIEAPEQNVTDFQALQVETQSSNQHHPLTLPSLFETVSQPCHDDTDDFIDVETISQESSPVATIRPQILANDAADLIEAQNKLNQTIEDKLNQQNGNMLNPNQPSSLLLAKLNAIRKKLAVEANETTVAPDTAIQNPEPFAFPNEIAQITDNIHGFIGIDSNAYLETKALVIINESFVNTEEIERPTQVKPERTSYDDELPCTSSSVRFAVEGRRNIQAHPVASTSSIKVENVVTDNDENILQSNARILERFEDFQKNFEYILNEKGITIGEADLPPTPPPTPRANFVHITADTTPEELTHLKAISNNNHMSLSVIEKNPATTYPHITPYDPNLICIGPNRTVISKADWSKIDWNHSVPAITRKVMLGVFDRHTMATHTLTGRPSPAFKDLNKPKKKPLDASKVDDIVDLITSYCNTTTKEIRMAITTKCADECKMLKHRKSKGQ